MYKAKTAITYKKSNGPLRLVVSRKCFLLPSHYSTTSNLLIDYLFCFVFQEGVNQESSV